MKETFSTDIEFICETMQRTLDDFNGEKHEEILSLGNQLSKYIEMQKFNYNDGKPFAILSARFYSRSNMLDFFVLFDDKWYRNASEEQLQLIRTLNMNIKNCELETPIFLQISTFDCKTYDNVNKSFYMSENLKVKYNDCVIGRHAKSVIERYARYHMGGCVEFDNCVFVEN